MYFSFYRHMSGRIWKIQRYFTMLAIVLCAFLKNWENSVKFLNLTHFFQKFPKIWYLPTRIPIWRIQSGRMKNIQDPLIKQFQFSFTAFKLIESVMEDPKNLPYLGLSITLYCRSWSAKEMSKILEFSQQNSTEMANLPQQSRNFPNFLWLDKKSTCCNL